MNTRRMLMGLPALAVCTAAYGQFEVPWFTVDGGGGMASTGGALAVSGTIGQPDAGAMSGGGYTVRGGFWVEGIGGGGPAACGCGDLDNNGTVDLVDFTTLATCFGLNGPDPSCEGSSFFCADLDGDGSISLNDFSKFSTAFGLAPVGNPPDCQ